MTRRVAGEKARRGVRSSDLLPHQQGAATAPGRFLREQQGWLTTTAAQWLLTLGECFAVPRTRPPDAHFNAGSAVIELPDYSLPVVFGCGRERIRLLALRSSSWQLCLSNINAASNPSRHKLPVPRCCWSVVESSSRIESSTP